MMDKPPSYAEHFTRSDFTKDTRRESRILPHRTHAGPDICSCPRCDAVFADEWEHGVQDRCQKCDLNVLCFGNGIYIWDTIFEVLPALAGGEKK